MVNQVYKRQKFSNAISNHVVSPTDYDEPNKTLMNFPSSIMNGVTEEGGLVSLTFKSIKCVELVENLDWMRNTIIRNDENNNIFKFTDEEYNASEVIDKLKKEVEILKKEETVSVNEKEDMVHTLRDNLSDKVLNKENISPLGDQLTQLYEKENPGKSISFVHNKGIEFKSFNLDGIKVDKFEDVKEPDLTPYQRKEIVAATGTNEEVQSEQQREISSTPMNPNSQDSSYSATPNYSVTPAPTPIQVNPTNTIITPPSYNGSQYQP